VIGVESSVSKRATYAITAESVLLALLLGLSACVLVLTVDHQLFDTNFHTLWEATALFAGDHPYRDFFDWGLPLQAVVSVLGQLASGHRLIGEFVADWLFMLASIAIAFRLALRVSTSRVASVATMLLAVLLLAVTPVYHYPKLFIYTASVWLAWRYMDQPGRQRAAALGVMGAVAFLFRHDHGLFLGIGAALTILLGSPRARTDLLTCAAVTFALVLPYLVYVQMNSGLLTYFRTGVEFSQREASRQWHVWPRIVGDERPLQSAMVYELYAIPAIALIALARRLEAPDWKTTAARVAPLAVVALLVDVSFIRDPLLTRLADAIVPAVVVGSWLLARAFSQQPLRLLTAPLAAVFLVLMGASVLAVGSTYDEIDRTGLLDDREGIATRFVERTAELKTRFVDYQMPTRSSRLLVPFFRYVDRCTEPDDRLLVGGFMVEVPFYAQRLFAAGQEYFGAYFESDANERFAFERLQRQRVPFAIIPSDSDEEFDMRFPLVAPYVHTHYSLLTDVAVDEEQTIHILVRRDLPAAAHDSETGWPCFR
jgi:hypothetical protein